MSTAWPAEQRLQSLDWESLPAVRGDVTEALGAVLAGQEAARALTRLLRQHPTWSGAERSVAAEAVLGVALWRRRLRHHSVDGYPGALLDALLRHLAGAGGQSEAPPRDWPTRLSYPDWLAEEFRLALGEEAEAFAAASNLPGPVTVRANTLRLSQAALGERLRNEGVATRPTAHAPHGLLLDGRPNVLGLPSHQSGLFEVQDEGSQLVGRCLDVHPGDCVLDLCAGSGGKTLLLGAALDDKGRLYAFDVDPAALERLEHRAARAGIGQSLRVLRTLPGRLVATHVLVDAPCSALGTLRRGPDVRWRLAPSSLEAFPGLQGELLEKAAACTAPGGHLVYATCTIRRQENQHVVERFLSRHRDFSREPAPVPQSLRSSEGDLLTGPHRHGMDGFYAAVLRRRAG